MIPPSSLLCLIEVWLARQVPDEILADVLEEVGRYELAGRLRRLGRLKGKRRKTAESRLTRDIIYLMPRMRVRQYAAARNHHTMEA